MTNARAKQSKADAHLPEVVTWLESVYDTLFVQAGKCPCPDCEWERRYYRLNIQDIEVANRRRYHCDYRLNYVEDYLGHEFRGGPSHEQDMFTFKEDGRGCDREEFTADDCCPLPAYPMGTKGPVTEEEERRWLETGSIYLIVDMGREMDNLHYRWAEEALTRNERWDDVPLPG